ncbi:peptidylprolyl isomerase [Rhodovulum adriaticum]|uniref:Parvulin-like PPIase n=1 Tax=Rhodovulum adriaticum TaxID=35804 RepID=A0A4R2P0V4_RHOAD|nr:peptidylprolyl isomerase [Rhodovulum adriaticum]MBK1635010.1 peptidylprolyl isomerase [Rhodovulum adriaticum]TCP27481.1 peptidyl-prolyl cis-trans isomerase C [Rhodovulum adriaticum]
MPKAMKPLLALAMSAALALPAAAEEIGADTVVARVGGDTITLGHMIVMRAQLPAEYQQLPDDVLYEAVLDQLIRQSAVAQSVGEDLSLGAKLALENEQRSFVAGEALGRIAEAAVTDEALQTAYEAAFAGEEPEREFNAAHILVETEEEALAIKTALDKGADFTEMAKEQSVGPSGPNGGDLGWFTAGMMVKPFEDAVMSLEPGEVSAPVQTQFGWHIVKLNDSRLKEAPTLEEVRPELVQQIQRDAMEAAMEELTDAAEVERAELDLDPAIIKDRGLLE